MELDELKSAWAEYDKKLTNSLKLNEQVLRNINTQQSRLELQKPLTYEATGAVMMIVLEAVLIIWSLRVEQRIAIPGFIAAFIGLFYWAFAFIKAYAFFDVNYYGTSVVALQKEIAAVNALVLRLRKVEILLAPFFVMAALPLMYKVVHNVDVYEKPTTFWIGLAVILIVSVPLTIGINRFVYDKKFQNAAKLMNEISRFEEA
jgi:glucan phosphoethanolaminetransferase (alkaline phosphatase superfamily)